MNEDGNNNVHRMQNLWCITNLKKVKENVTQEEKSKLTNYYNIVAKQLEMASQARNEKLENKKINDLE